MRDHGNFLFHFLAGIILFQLFYMENVSFAQELKYSTRPVCQNNNVICRDSNEVAVCLSLDRKVHIETTTLATGEKVNRFQPSCGAFADNLLPYCIDIAEDGEPYAKNAVLECIEFVNCSAGEKNNTGQCSDGKVPACLGDYKEPNCTATAENICENGAIPVCELRWQASARDHLYH